MIIDKVIVYISHIIVLTIKGIYIKYANSKVIHGSNSNDLKPSL